MSIARKFLWIFITQIGTYVLGIGASIVVARALGPEGKGIFYLVTFLPHSLVALSCLGLETAILYFMGRYPEERREVAGQAVIMSLVLGGAWIIIYLALLPWLSHSYFKGVPLPLLLISLVSFPLIYGALFFPEALKGLERFKEFNLTVFLPSLLSQALIIVVLLVFKWGVAGAVFNWVFILALQAITGFTFLFILVRPRLAPKLKLSRAMVGYGLKAYLGGVMDTLLMRTGVFLLGYLTNPTAVGFYSVALIIEKLTYLPNAILGAFIPRLVNAGRSQARIIAPPVFRMGQTVILLSAAALLLLARPLVLVMYGKQFAPALQPLILLLPGITALCVARIAQGYFMGIGEPFKYSLCGIIAMPVSIAANLLLIPRYGINGAALGTSASFLVYAAAALFMFHSSIGVPWQTCWLPQPGDWRRLKELLGGRGLAAAPPGEEVPSEPL